MTVLHKAISRRLTRLDIAAAAMEAYPPEYVEHNLPLVLLSGLGHESAKVGKAALRQDSGPRLVLGSEECVAQQAAQLLQALQSIDATEKAWHAATSSGPSGLIGYKMKAIGRVGMALLTQSCPC